MKAHTREFAEGSTHRYTQKAAEEGYSGVPRSIRIHGTFMLSFKGWRKIVEGQGKVFQPQRKAYSRQNRMICMCLAGQGLAGGGRCGEQGLKCPLTHNQCEVVVCAGKSRGKLQHRLERTKKSGKPERQNEGMKGVAICLERRECQHPRE